MDNSKEKRMEDLKNMVFDLTNENNYRYTTSIVFDKERFIRLVKRFLKYDLVNTTYFVYTSAVQCILLTVFSWKYILGFITLNQFLGITMFLVFTFLLLILARVLKELPALKKRATYSKVATTPVDKILDDLFSMYLNDSFETKDTSGD